MATLKIGEFEVTLTPDQVNLLKNNEPVVIDLGSGKSVMIQVVSNGNIKLTPVGLDIFPQLYRATDAFAEAVKNSLQ